MFEEDEALNLSNPLVRMSRIFKSAPFSSLSVDLGRRKVTVNRLCLVSKSSHVEWLILLRFQATLEVQALQFKGRLDYNPENSLAL